jgi:hypothetical protein
MKTSYKLLALGVGAASVLHAQAKPPAFVLGEVTVKDEDGYKKDFLPVARKVISDQGGKYIGRRSTAPI